MEKYKNTKGTSGVTHFQIGEDYIAVKFKDKAAVYTYNYSLNGKEHIEAMKIKARQGFGLGTYISRHPAVRMHYIRK